MLKLKQRLFVLVVLSALCQVVYANDSEFLNYVNKRILNATAMANNWDGPRDGPMALPGRKIVFVASDLRNGGVNGVAQGVSEAIAKVGWDLRFIDALGSEVRQQAALRRAISMKPDGIVLGGIDIETHKETLKIAQQLGISVVGWHSSESLQGNLDLGLFANITTDPMEVAEVAALLAVANSSAKLRAAIFTDSRYSIATLKADVMKKTIEQCSSCEIVGYFDLPLDTVANDTHKVIQTLVAENKISHLLVINDLYIDFATPVYEKIQNQGLPVPVNISAGDGSRAAYERIKANSFQLATVPEPLYMQGWQVVDELNRSFHGFSPSNYIAPVHIVTKENVSALIGKSGVYDPANDYRDAYLSIWLGESK